MAILFIDGFDKYGPASQTTPTVSNLLTAGEWTSTGIGTGSISIVAGLSVNGQALALAAGVSGSQQTTVNKSIGNVARLIGGVRFSLNADGSQFPMAVVFTDTVTAQCCITKNITTGTISLRLGDPSSATIIATSVTTVSLSSTHYIEWDINFGTSVAYQVWLDGSSVFSGTATTKSTANNYANIVTLRSPSISSAIATFDDFYLFDSTGATCNAVLNNNPVVETAFVNADTATKQWSAGAAIIGTDNSVSGTTNAPGANQLFTRTFTAAQNMTLNSVSCVPAATSGVAKFKAVLYGTVQPTGAHRYWRIFQYATVGGGTSRIAEIQFRTTAGVSLLFSGGSAAVNTGTAASAIDNNPATDWTGAGTTGNWFSYDYGSTITIVEVTLQCNAASTSGAFTNFDLQYSDDNVTWNTAANFTPSWVSAAQIQTFTVSTRPTTVGSVASALIATGTEVFGTTSGTTLTAPFASGQLLTASTQYAIGFITDTSVTLSQSDAANSGWKIANTYTSGAPATLPSQGTSGTNSWQIWGNCTSPATNYAGINTNPPVDDISYNWSATVNQEDLYGFPALFNTPASITAVAYKARVKKSDAGFRTVEVHCASGVTDTAGSTAGGVTPGTSYSWVGNYQPTDPNTSSAWSSSGVNAATGGVKVSS